MYRIECLIDDEWKPMSDNGLIVYYHNQNLAHLHMSQLQILCSEHGMEKQFRVVSHIF